MYLPSGLTQNMDCPLVYSIKVSNSIRLPTGWSYVSPILHQFTYCSNGNFTLIWCHSSITFDPVTTDSAYRQHHILSRRLFLWTIIYNPVVMSRTIILTNLVIVMSYTLLIVIEYQHPFLCNWRHRFPYHHFWHDYHYWEWHPVSLMNSSCGLSISIKLSQQWLLSHLFSLIYCLIGMPSTF